jgi:hypothetical protein
MPENVGIPGSAADAVPLVPCPGPVRTCPPSPPDTADPTPESLSCGLTLPSALATPSVACEAARVVLGAHGLADLEGAALLVVEELTSCACRFTPGGDSVYLSLRYRGDALRVVVFDGHPPHGHPVLAAHCDARRRAQLDRLATAVEGYRGDWGFGDAREPAGGTRSWAVLPRTAARR